MGSKKVKEISSEYQTLVDRAEEIDKVRRLLLNDLLTLKKDLSEFENKYEITLHDFDKSVTEDLLPMTAPTRVGAGILVDEYVDIRENRRYGKYKIYNRFKPSSGE
jgi:hypothetical protein